MSAGHLGAIIGGMSEDRIDPRIAKGLATALFVAVGVSVPLLLSVADIPLPELPDLPHPPTGSRHCCVGDGARS